MKANICKQHRAAKKTVRTTAKTHSRRIHLSNLPFAISIRLSLTRQYTHLQALHTPRRRERAPSNSFLQVSTPVQTPSANDQAAIWRRLQAIWRVWIEVLACMVWHRAFGVENWKLSIGQSVTRAKGHGSLLSRCSPHLTSRNSVSRSCGASTTHPTSRRIFAPSHTTHSRRSLTPHTRERRNKSTRRFP